MEQIEDVTVMAKRILGVVRVSTVAQETESQTKELQEFIVSKGYRSNQIVWVQVKGASARQENDKYLAMIDKIKCTIEAKEVEAVALWHLNRLGRTETSLNSMKEYFEKKKIQVYIKNPSLQLFNDDKTLNYGCSIAWSLFATMIKFDTIEQFEKTQRGKRYAKEEGKCVSGRARYGYTIDSNKFIHENSKESKIVRLIYDKYINENTTAKQIAQWLNENGYTFRQSEQCTESKLWTESKVRIILSNTTYIGKGKYKYPAIIDEEQFRKCQEIRKSRNIFFDRALANKEIKKYYLCSKLIKCEYCGHSYEPKGKNYEDAGARSYYGSQRCIHGMSIPIKYADIAIKRSYFSCYMMYLDNAEKEDKNKLNLEIINLQTRIVNIEKSLLKLEDKKKRINDLYIEGNIDKKQYNDNLTKVKTEISDIDERIEDFQRQIQSKQIQIQMIDDNKLNDSEKLAGRYDKISIYSKEEIYNRIHDKKNKLINYAYIRKVRIDNRIMTVFNVVTNIGKDTYLIDSFNRKEENKLMSVFSLKGKIYVSRYIESEEIWIPDLSGISQKIAVEVLDEMRKK